MVKRFKRTPTIVSAPPLLPVYGREAAAPGVFCRLVEDWYGMKMTPNPERLKDPGALDVVLLNHPARPGFGIYCKLVGQFEPFYEAVKYDLSPQFAFALDQAAHRESIRRGYEGNYIIFWLEYFGGSRSGIEVRPMNCAWWCSIRAVDRYLAQSTPPLTEGRYVFDVRNFRQLGFWLPHPYWKEAPHD